MQVRDFKKYDLIVGWSVFAISLITYAMSVEPTISFWDCGEYIVTSAKLQVGHPPGAPIFQMIGAFFASFAPTPEKVALFVNYVSVVSSAFTVLFLYFITVNFTKKIYVKDAEDVSVMEAVVVFSSGVIGGLTYAFSDSFWFNAVEAEVYGMAMLFMSGMFWLGVKWTDNLYNERGDKWLLMICLVTGLSFGVHFMALLTIPAIGMLYFFRSRYEKNVKNFVIANVVSTAVLLVIFKLILPYTLSFFAYSEIFFVNSLGFPFNTGTIFAGVLMVLIFVYGLRYFRKKGSVVGHTLTLCLIFVLVGFSSWIMIPIRANANVVVNENSPTDARLLLAYYNLEQYPTTHLFYGPMYTDKYADQDAKNPYSDEKPKYERDYKKGEYVIVNHYKNAILSPNSKHEGILPRMWSFDNAGNYMRFGGIPKITLKPEYYGNKDIEKGLMNFEIAVNRGDVGYDDIDKFLSYNKEYLEIEKPDFFDNLQYLFAFQIDYMYLRYFMWNFVGRQDDVQGKLDNHGNWISGINFIDKYHLGLSQDNLSKDDKENKGRNVYYFLPLLLGLVGLSYHYGRSKQTWWVVFVLFMFTGLALKIYLNERAFEPRERDYALVGSFFTFSIWVGMGVAGIGNLLREYKMKNYLIPAACLVCAVAVPANMAKENWDDHSRAGKYTARTIAKAYLDCIAKDKGAMLFTIGDNDTFNFWYMQEAEQYRRDIRVINTSLLATDWYIDQMKRKAYTSEGIPSQIPHSKYAYGVRDAIYNSGLSENRWNIKDIVNWMVSEKEEAKISFRVEDDKIDYATYPTNKVRIPVNKENVLKSGVVRAEDADKIVDYIDIELPQTGIGKNRMMMLDIIANNDWKRPIYFTGGSINDEEYIWMKDYLQMDGLVYKLVPIKTEKSKGNPYDMGRIDTDLSYKMVKRLDWKSMADDNIYHDTETRRNCVILRGNLSRLVEALLKEDKKKEAKDVIDIAVKNMPVEKYGYYFTIEPYVDGYYKVGDVEAARKLYNRVADRYNSKLAYYASLTDEEVYNISEDVQYDLYRYASLIKVLKDNKDSDFAKKQEEILMSYSKAISKNIGSELVEEEQEAEKAKEDTIKRAVKDSVEDVKSE